ncbi:hypothetical protein JCGZ_09895 [Jatropha curcas]|uniref:Uncharacterized protein n=1 Tax=Jatropha curcas TaxID=180498 RepID=A0A067KLP2_JATCU|nr:hypothetical protein JCGZ_09895 [Jatropha curcas]
MAPTAAMLILPTHIKSPSPPSTASPLPPYSFFEVKFSAIKWFKGRYNQDKDSSTTDLSNCLPAVDSSSSAMEKSFEESLEHSCWS